MERLELGNILKLNKLENELEFEQATSLYGKLRWMVKEDSSLEPVRQHLKILIKRYEETNWGNEQQITDKQIEESDHAEKVVSLENEFIHKRKEIIRKKLKENDLTQKDLAKILGHRPNYMSELINGIRPLSRDDIIILHRLFDIDFKYLVPPFLKSEITNHIKSALGELKSKRIKLKLRDLETV